MTEKDIDIELIDEILSTLRTTVASQQLEIIDLRAQLNLANSRLEKLKTSSE